MKKLFKQRISMLMGFLVIVLLAGCMSFPSAISNPKVVFDGKEIAFKSPPIVEKGHLLADVQTVFERLGAKVTWNAKAKTMTAKKGSIVVTVQAASLQATVDKKKIKLETAPKMVKDRLFAPVKFVGEALGYETKWDGQKRVATIRTIAAKPSSTPTPAKAVTPAPTKAGTPANSLAGVWMGLYTPYGQYTAQERYLVIYEDGTFFHELPLLGLEGFDPKASKNDEKEKAYWGTYTFNGTSGTWKYNSAGSIQMSLKLNKEGNLEIGSETYYRCSSVDGLRLDGAWIPYDSIEGLMAWEGDEETKSILRFKPDGKFEDEGLFMQRLSFIQNAYNSDERVFMHGKGTYEIKNYTLILKYSDGREVKAAFSLHFKDKQQPKPEKLFILRTPMNRL